MHRVVNDIKSFLWHVSNSSGVTFDNMNTAVGNFLRSVVHEDITRMQQIAEHYADDYRRNHAAAVGGMQHSINWVTKSESFPGKINGADHIYRNATLSYIKDILAIGTDDENSTQTTVTLSRLLRRPEEWEYCQIIFMDLALLLNNPIEAETSVNKSKLLDKSSQPYGPQSALDYTKDLRKCLHGMNDDMARVSNQFAQIRKTITNVRLSPEAFRYNRVLENVRDDISDLQRKMSWFSKQTHLYAQNITTKLDLSGNVTRTIVTEIESTIQRILRILEKKIIGYLRILADMIEKEVRNVYFNGLAGMGTVGAYYDNNDIEDQLRMLRIWRQPVFQISIPEVVRFRYSASESWNSWSTSTTLQQFVLDGAHDKVISDITRSYANTMRQEVLKQNLEFASMKDDIVSSLTHLVEELEYIKRQGTMDDIFVA